MILVNFQPTKGRLGWYSAKPSAYSEAVRVVMGGFPGVKWNDLDAWHVPRDVMTPLTHKLISAKIAKVRVLEEADVNRRMLAKLLATTCDDPDLRAYQNEGVTAILRGLAADGGFLLADDMGLGKTVQALVAADFRGAESILVVCPAIMVRKWRAEAAKWAPGAEVVALSWDMMRSPKTDLTELIKRLDMVIVDEIHYGSNPRAKRTIAVRAALEAARAHSEETRYRTLPVLGLSGTPMTNEPADLWAPLDMLFPGRFGVRSSFERRYCDGHLEEIEGLPKKVWVAKGITRADELAARLKHVMIRRTKDDVGDELPPRTRSIVPVEVPKNVIKAQQVQARLMVEGERTNLGELLSLTEIAKVENACELARDLMRQGHRPLLVTTRKQTAREIGKQLNCPVVDGDVAPGKREDKLADARCAAATMYSIETGIDLVQFDCMIVVGLDWLHTRLLQVESRIHRLTSQRGVAIYYLIAVGSFDELVRDRVLMKLEAATAILGSSNEEDKMKALLAGGTEEELIAALADQIAA